VLHSAEETHSKDNVLHPNGPSPLYTYTTRPDILQVPRPHIWVKADVCTATGRTYTFAAEDNDKISKINKKQAFFHKQI
jgi:hypothetical protein